MINWNDLYKQGNSTLKNLQEGGSFTSFANTPNSGALQVQSAVATNPGIPSWLSDPGTGELLNQYKGIGDATNNAINPLHAAAQESMAFNLGAGGQAASNAAREYAARMAQSGGSRAGAGVVKAQALLPTLQANSDIRSKAADTEAQYKFNALKLSTDVATQLAGLRTDYAKTLANYVTTTRGQDINLAQGNQDAALRAQIATMQNTTQNRSLTLQDKQQGNSSQIDAAKALLASKQPFASYNTDNYGKITSGQESYNNYQSDLQQRAQAKALLAGLI